MGGYSFGFHIVCIFITVATTYASRNHGNGMAAETPGRLRVTRLNHGSYNIPVEGKFIVTFKESHTRSQINKIMDGISKTPGCFLTGKYLGFDYLHTLCEVTGNREAIDVLRTKPEVRFVEPVQLYHEAQANYKTECTCVEEKSVKNWALDRVDQRNLPLSGKYYSLVNSSPLVNLYVMDTGIFIDHEDFHGRAVWGTNTIDSDTLDRNGHGTYVAGVAGGTSYGIAKTSSLISVKVMDQFGVGTTSSILEGLEWVRKDIREATSHRGVVIMALSGPYSPAINSAVKRLFNEQVPVVVAAGNSGINACMQSPASAPMAITVGCSDRNDAACPYSNFGSCVDIIAPGAEIISAGIGNKTTKRMISGTSMSAAHVAGVLANYLGCNPKASAEDVTVWLIKSSTEKKVTKLQDRTPNRLLFSPSCKSPPPMKETTGPTSLFTVIQQKISEAVFGILKMFGLVERD